MFKSQKWLFYFHDHEQDFHNLPFYSLNNQSLAIIVGLVKS